MKIVVWNLNGIKRKRTGEEYTVCVVFHIVYYCTFEGFLGFTLACGVRIIYSGDRLA